VLAQVAIGRTRAADEEARLLREQRRGRIHALDGCLEQLEVALERGVRKVPPGLARRVGALVPAISPGLSTPQAIEFVFRAQEAALRVDGAAHPEVSSGNSRHGHPREDSLGIPLDGQRARLLTERIKQGLADPSLLLLDAHEGSAWRALGYRSWEAYVREEFGLSRSRSYEMLDHGRVVRGLMSAAGLDTLPEVSPFAASQIKSRLEQAVAEIASRAATHPGKEQARNIVHDVVNRTRAEFKAATPDVNAKVARLPFKPQPFSDALEPQAERAVHDKLHDAVSFLMALNDPQQVLASVGESDCVCLEGLREAAERLSDIADALESTREARSGIENRPEFRTGTGFTIVGAREGTATTHGASAVTVPRVVRNPGRASTSGLARQPCSADEGRR
jgi:hypothetical protein